MPLIGTAKSAGVMGAAPRHHARACRLTLLYQPQALCSSGEQISEALLEGLILGCPADQRLHTADAAHGH